MRLLEPIKVGKIELKNRVMFPPMTTGYEGRDGTIENRALTSIRDWQKVACPILYWEMLLL